MLVQIFTRFKTVEDTTTQGSSQMAKIRFKRLPACNRGESIKSGSQQPPKDVLIAPDDASQCRRTSQGPFRCSARLHSLPRSSELKRSFIARTEIEDTNIKPETEANVKIQSRHDSATGKLSVSPGQLQAGAEMPLKHPYRRYTFHEDLFAARYVAEDTA